MYSRSFKEYGNTVVDFYEAGGATGISAFLSGKNALEEIVMLQKVVGQSIMQRIEGFTLRPFENDTPDIKERELYREFIANYNPDVLYATILWPANFKGYNLLVLRKSSLKPGEKRQIIEKGDKFWYALSYSGEFYHYRNRPNPWEDLVKEVEGLMLRTEPMLDRTYAKIGTVIDWKDGTNYNRGGLIVKTPDIKAKVLLTNTNDRERFSHLIGKVIKYHFMGYYDVNGIIDLHYGELVSPTLYIPLDDTPKLSSGK